MNLRLNVALSLTLFVLLTTPCNGVSTGATRCTRGLPQ